MRRESGVVKSWGQELEVESGRPELSQELGPGRVGSLGSAKSGGKPSQESRGRVWARVWAWAWRVCYGDWLRNAWSGCSNWLHYLWMFGAWLDIYAAVMISGRIWMLHSLYVNFIQVCL